VNFSYNDSQPPSTHQEIPRRTTIMKKNNPKAIGTKIKKKTRSYSTSKWVTLEPGDLENLFCPSCLETIQRLFGGKWVYVPKGRTKERERKLDIIRKMVNEDCEPEEIMHKLGLKSRQHLQYYKKILIQSHKNQNKK
jgi:hypothetical protein